MLFNITPVILNIIEIDQLENPFIAPIKSCLFLLWILILTSFLFSSHSYSYEDINSQYMCINGELHYF